MLKLSQNIVNYFSKAEKVKIYFYTSWCAWNKVDITDNFEINDDLVLLETNYDFEVYALKNDIEKIKDSIITRIDLKQDEENEHIKWKKFKYIFVNDNIKERCGCWTSFSFEKKKLKINFDKLKSLKNQS